VNKGDQPEEAEKGHIFLRGLEESDLKKVVGYFRIRKGTQSLQRETINWNATTKKDMWKGRKSRTGEKGYRAKM